MPRRLLDEKNLGLFIERVKQITPESQGHWGSLTSSGMLFHCNKINNEILKQKASTRPTFKQRLFKILLYLMTKLPKDVQTSRQYVPQKSEELNFENEKLAYIETLTRFANYKGPIQGNHPFFGPLNTNEWRRFVYLHIDHHLRQFGV